MTAARANDLTAFRDFIDAKLANGEAILTPIEALDLWEYENSPEEEREDTMRAIQQGLDDMHAGRTRDARDMLDELRRKHNLGA